MRGLAGEENRSIFAPALRHKEAWRVEAKKFITYWEEVFLELQKALKIKSKKNIFLLARFKRGGIFAPAKTAKDFN
ncbi:hypothetical protein SAMN05660903_03712 [Salegentibacter salinarum]|nr:hypothetical protein SAMN05660903_03712 [Salegentibacter salinarum]